MPAPISLAPIAAKIAELKAAGAPQIAPDAWNELMADFQRIVAEVKEAQADGKLSLSEVWTIAQTALEIAGDIAALASQLFPKA